MASARFVSVNTILLHICFLGGVLCKFQPNWPSLDSRVAPQWYDEAKFGIFIHWGVFSVPSFSSEWFWNQWKGPDPDKNVVAFMNKNYPPDFTYADFAQEFKAEFFDADEWTKTFQEAGAKYIVFVGKHHEGYTNWPSKASFNWNSMDVGPHRDIVGELATSIRNKSDIHFGIYHSMYEWFHPLYLQDKANKFHTQDFVTRKTGVELHELVDKYHPDIIWSDGDWEASDTYWNSTNFLAWLYNESPVKDSVLVNDRWGKGTACKHGDFYNCQDKFSPGVLQSHKWENCMSIDKWSWGYRREAKITDMLSVQDVISELAMTVSCGGNLLLNIGPTSSGRIIPVFEERLKQIGGWLKINGEAIYNTNPWSSQNDTKAADVWYTKAKSTHVEDENTLYFNSKDSSTIYAIFLTWPSTGYLDLSSPSGSSTTQISLLGYKGRELTWQLNGDGAGINVNLSSVTFTNIPSPYAWVLKITNVVN